MPDRAWRHRLVRGAAAMALAVIGISSPGRLGAQAATPSGVVARPGELVRVRTAQWEYTGTLARVVGDTALLRFSGDSVLVPRSLVTSAQVQRGTRRSVPRIVMGSLMGATGGLLIGVYAGVFAECGSSCRDEGEYAGLAGGLVGAAAGTVLGAIGGGIWGASKRYPRWIPAALP